MTLPDATEGVTGEKPAVLAGRQQRTSKKGNHGNERRTSHVRNPGHARHDGRHGGHRAPEYQTALATQNQAEAALLGRIIETVKPALRALASRIKKYDFSTSGRNGCNPVSSCEYFDERGVMLVNDFERAKDSTGNEGTYGGSRLYLLDDGTLAYVSREGTWSCWQGAADTYTATLGSFPQCGRSRFTS